MNRKMMIHGITIIAIMIAVFAAAAFTPAKADTHTTGTAAAMNLVKADIASRVADADGRMIADTEIPLSAAPFETDGKSSAMMIVLTAAAVITGIVIIEEFRDKRANRLS